MKYRDFLLEIDVEELPVSYIRPALEMLEESFQKELKAQRIAHGEFYLAGTATMLLCFIKDVSLMQGSLSQKVLGPPKRISFDEKGNPTKQALGFANAQGVKVEDLRIEKTAKGEYIVLDKKTGAGYTKDILLRISPQVIKDIGFPKTMRWDDSGLRFARPIESVLALFGKEKLDVKIGNVPPKKINSVSASGYLKQVRKKGLVDPDTRKEAIKKLILGAVRKLKADQDIDENLLEEVNFMVDSPAIFIGGFDREFLRLPEEVLKASMSKYQRIFPVSKEGRLINKFIAVIEKDGRDIKGVRKNYENILEARLKDSLFFFKEDTKKPLSENINQLKDLIFQKDLGNMFEKIQRLQVLCSFICEKLNTDSSLRINTQRAAELSKADLVSHMVGEFPSLQGVMGREYALKSGEKKEIAVAVREHYLPQGIDDRLPGSLEGAILAVADRIDNIVGFIGMGADISGSFDPFGIRRNTHGLIHIIKDKSFGLGLDELIQKAMELYVDKLKSADIQLKEKIAGYIKERIEFLAGEIRPLELKRAVLAVGRFDIVDIFKRIRVLSSISQRRYFLEAAKVVERTSNILKGAEEEKIGKVDRNLFKEDLEREVWKVYLNSKDKIMSLVDTGKYEEATREYGQAFFKVLHEFFDRVLVNAEDPSLRLNRLAMMKAINELYTKRIADLAMLPQIVVK